MHIVRSHRFWSTYGRAALAPLVIIAGLVSFVPFVPTFPSNSLDDGWRYALNVAVAKNLVFGRNVIFTFGPYASTYTKQFAPETNTQMLWSGCLLAIAFSMGLLCLTKGYRTAVALGLAVFMVLVPVDARFYALQLIVLLLVFRITVPPGRPEHIASTIFVQLVLALLVIAFGILTLVKGSFAVASGIVMVVSCIALVLRGRVLLALGGAVLFLASIAVLWIIAGQPLAALPNFFLAQAPIISGYSAAMSTPGPTGQILVFLGCCALFGLLNTRSLRSAGHSGLLLMTGGSAILFLAFKEGFVRDDGHSLIAAGELGITGWMIMLLGRKGVTPILSLIIGLGCWGFITGSKPNLSVASLKSDIETPFILAGDDLVVRLMHPAQLQKEYANSLKTIQAEQPLPTLSGTTDIYSYGQSALLAKGLDWDPRPVLQSYSAYTASLERKDAKFLTTEAAPANVMFAVQPLDNKLPALDDGASWPDLLTRYDIIGQQSDAFGGNLIILHRRLTQDVGNSIAKDPVLSGSFRLDERILMPKETPLLWAEIDVKPTPLGRLFALLFKPPHLDITYSFSDDQAQTFRYVAGMGESGFMAAPLIRNTTDFAALTLPDAANYFQGLEPVSLSISAEHGTGWLWRSSFDAKFFAMHIPVQLRIGRLLFRPLEMQPQSIAKLSTTSDCSIDIINRQPAGHRPITAGSFLQVEGWAAISLNNGVAPDAIAITLTAPDGSVQTANAQIVDRKDVNLGFDKPDMGPVGFAVAVDLDALSGNYELGIEETRGTEKLLCESKVPIKIVNSVTPE